jgi:hypothetical protein
MKTHKIITEVDYDKYEYQVIDDPYKKIAKAHVELLKIIPAQLREDASILVPQRSRVVQSLNIILWEGLEYDSKGDWKASDEVQKIELVLGGE